ncbi:MAG TPA: L,D-transpeptidase [Gaiellaceae bacterium]|nr:L,D-transpeptidase [Gaiellaceae bacterium]
MLTGPTVASWAHVERRIWARAEPRIQARRVGLLRAITPEFTSELVTVLERYVRLDGAVWYRVRLPVLPNRTTGWVPRDALGDLQETRTSLVIDRRALSATLYRRGKVMFRARVGIGQPQWPTPSGSFVIRNRLRGFTDPLYGPVAFGTSARSPVLTDWPGGGFIGIHGTDTPEILPGRVSHGCVRMSNPDILRLAQLLAIGTPVTIR